MEMMTGGRGERGPNSLLRLSCYRTIMPLLCHLPSMSGTHWPESPCRRDDLKGEPRALASHPDPLPCTC